MRATTTSRRADWGVPALLILLSLVPAAAGTARLAELGRGAAVTASNARFLAQPLPVVLHVLAVIPFSILGALQFSPAFRRRRRGWHRAAGRVLGVCGLVAALTGLWMAHFYAWPPGDGVRQCHCFSVRTGYDAWRTTWFVVGPNSIRLTASRPRTPMRSVRSCSASSRIATYGWP